MHRDLPGDGSTLARVVILTEAGPSVGLGHLARCAALYDALECVGATCELVVAGEAPRHVAGDRRVRVCEWRAPGDAASAISGADCAVIDSYHATEAIYREVASCVGAAAYLDDTARLNYPAGIIINGMPEADLLPLQAGGARTMLTGVRYQILRREFWEAPERVIRTEVQRVLVIAGGTDATGARAGMADAARHAFPTAELDMVDAPRDVAAIRIAMAEADVAVSAAGQTLYELAALGTPTVAVCVAENQLPQARALDRAGIVLLAGLWSDVSIAERISSSLVELAGQDRRERMSSCGQRVIDGRGALRVARALVRAVLEQRLDVRPAGESDEADLLELANDPLVRGMSFSTASIDPGTHHAWLVRVLADNSALLLVGRDRNALLGQVRFDTAEDSDDAPAREATVSISVAPRYRGFGAAGLLLERAITVLCGSHPHVTALLAHVRGENAASRSLFEAAGFHATVEPIDGAVAQPSSAIVYRCELGDDVGSGDSR